jgi:hypothetical protein
MPKEVKAVGIAFSSEKAGDVIFTTDTPTADKKLITDSSTGAASLQKGGSRSS